MKLGWKGALGIVLSVLLLVWTLRGIDVADIVARLRMSNLPLLMLAAALATTTFPLRALRWRVILAPVDPDVPLGPLWRSTAIGMMINNVVPARVGELARAFALTRERPRIALTSAVASIGVDRVFDAIVLFGLMFGAMLTPAFPGARVIGGRTVTGLAATATAGIGVMLVVLYALVLYPGSFAVLTERLVGLASAAWAKRAHAAVLAFADGLSVLRSPSRFAAVLGWTLAHWLCNALAFWLGFIAVGMDVPYSVALFVQGVIGIGVAVPSSPGFFGVFEAAAKVGLHDVYRVPEPLAVTWAIGYHILSFIPITVIGAWYASRLGFSLRQLDDASAGDAPLTSDTPKPAGRGA
jgi:glycosyltransferase 2 family protein